MLMKECEADWLWLSQAGLSEDKLIERIRFNRMINLFTGQDEEKKRRRRREKRKGKERSTRAGSDIVRPQVGVTILAGRLV